MDHNALALVADAKPSELNFLAQVVVLVVLGRLAGEGMQRIGQPAVMGQILAGLLLGPSVFGLLWPSAQAEVFPASVGQKEMLDGLATLGVLMLLLLTGMETDLRLVRRIGRPAITVSIGGILLPFLLGVVLGVLLPDAVVPTQGKRIVTALFLGTALSISSVKIVAMVVRELGFQRRNIGQILLASSVRPRLPGSSLRSSRASQSVGRSTFKASFGAPWGQRYFCSSASPSAARSSFG